MTNEKTQGVERAEQARALNVKNTLEWKLMQETVGFNGVDRNQGDWGRFGVQSAKSIHNEAMTSEDAVKRKNEMYEKKQQDYNRVGVAGDPSYSNHQELSYSLLTQLQEVMTIAKFGEIEKHTKDIVEKLGGSKLEFQVPEDMKNYSIAGIMEKYKDEKTGTVNLSKLSESDREAYMFYENFLSTSYKKACEATAASKGNYFAELNAQAKQQLGKKYELKEKKE